MKEKMKDLLVELCFLDHSKNNGDLPPYRSKKSEKSILELIDKLENAIAWFDQKDSME